MEMAGSRRGVRKFLCKIGLSILYDVFRDEFHVPCLHQLGEIIYDFVKEGSMLPT